MVPGVTARITGEERVCAIIHPGCWNPRTLVLPFSRTGRVVEGAQHAHHVPQRNVGEIAFGDGPKGFTLKIQDGPPARLPAVAGDLQDLPKVEIAVDPLQRSGRYAVEPGKQRLQRLVIGPDGGTGFRPCLADALGYSGRNDLAWHGLHRCAKCVGQPAVDGGRSRAEGMCLGSEIGPRPGGIHGQSPGVAAAGEEFMGHRKLAPAPDGVRPEAHRPGSALAPAIPRAPSPAWRGPRRYPLRSAPHPLRLPG